MIVSPHRLLVFLAATLCSLSVQSGPSLFPGDQISTSRIRQDALHLLTKDVFRPHLYPEMKETEFDAFLSPGLAQPHREQAEGPDSEAIYSGHGVQLRQFGGGKGENTDSDNKENKDKDENSGTETTQEKKDDDSLSTDVTSDTSAKPKTRDRTTEAITETMQKQRDDDSLNTDVTSDTSAKPRTRDRTPEAITEATQEKRDDDSLSTDVTSDTSAKPKNIDRILEAITELEGIRKTMIDTLKEQDQSAAVKKVYKIISEICDTHPHLEEYFHVGKSNLYLADQAILLLLSLYFGDDLSSGDLTYLNLLPNISPDDDLLRAYLYETPHPPGEYPDLTVTHIVMTNTLFPLVRYLHENWEDIQVRNRKTYVLQYQNDHMNLVQVFRVSNTDYHFFIADGTNAFPHGNENIFSFNSELVVIAFAMVLEAKGISEAEFYFIPGSRQSDTYTCPVFVLNDLKTLKEHPVSEKYVVTHISPVKMSIWSPVLDDAVMKEGKLKVNGQPWIQSESLTRHVLRGWLGSILRQHTSKIKTIPHYNSNHLKFNKLIHFPAEYLRHTQSRERMEKFIRRLKGDEGERALQMSQEQQGMMTIDGQLKTEVNLSAAIEFVKLVIQVLEYFPDPQFQDSCRLL